MKPEIDSIADTYARAYPSLAAAIRAYAAAYHRGYRYGFGALLSRVPYPRGLTGVEAYVVAQIGADYCGVQ